MTWNRADAPRRPRRAPPVTGAEMAACPDAAPTPGFAVGCALLLVLSGTPVGGSSTLPPNNHSNSTTKDNNIAAIVAPPVTLGILGIILAVVCWLFCVVKKKRQTEGTYRPSAEEQCGVHSVSVPDALKLPKEERLI